MNFLPGLPRTAILRISASQLARIAGMSHWHPASLLSLLILLLRSCAYFWLVLNSLSPVVTAMFPESRA
jgi:hypothetical protein